MREKAFLGAATVGERGQIAIPADARRSLGIEPGTKMLFFTGPKDAGLFMVKAEELGRIIEHLTSKVQTMEELMKSSDEE